MQAYNLDSGVVDQIKNGDVEGHGKDVAEHNKADLEKRIGSVSSPVVFNNGKQVQIKSGPDGKPASWVPEVVK